MGERRIGVILSYANIILSTLINFLYVPILLKYIGKSEYGLYQLLGSLIAYFSMMDFGINAAIIRFYTKFKAVNDKVSMENLLAIALRMYIIISVIIVIIGIYIYIELPSIFDRTLTRDEIIEAKIMFIFLLGNVIANIVTMIFTAVINSNERFLFSKSLGIFQLVMQPFAIIAILQHYPYALSIVLVQTVLNIFGIVARGYYCIKKLDMSIRFHFCTLEFMKPILTLSFTTFIVVIIDQVFFKTNQIILGIISGTESVAVYSIASIIYTGYMQLSLAVSGVFIPHITAMIARSCTVDDLSSIFIKVGRFQYMVLSLCSCIFIIFGKEFISVWAGADFLAAYWITLVIIIPFTIDLIQNIGLAVMQAQNRYGFRAKVYACMGIFNLILAIPAAKYYGGIGCAIITGIALFLGNGIIMNWYYYKKIGIDIVIFWKGILQMSIPILLITVFVYEVNHFLVTSSFSLLCAKIFIYICLYIIVLYRWGVNLKEKKSVQSFLRYL